MPGLVIPDITPIIPEIIIVSFGLLLLLVDCFVPKDRKQIIGWLSIVGILGAAWASCTIGSSPDMVTFTNTFALDPYAYFFKVLFYIVAILSILLSLDYMKVEKANLGEYYIIILFATCGMMIMASAIDFITIYLGLELMALSVYVLVGILRHDLRSNEAALKYFILGALSSGVLVYGISIIYGVTGTTNLKAIATFLTPDKLDNPGIILAVIMLIVGFGFKVATVPFHMWTPDVYEGAPTPVTAFMSVGPKAAGFAVFLRALVEAFPAVQADWTLLLSILAVMTMAIGNVVAIAQTNVKRMLAYSSIAHAGYAMVGFVAGGPEGYSAVMLYLFIYLFMNLGAFGIVTMMRKGNRSAEELSDFAGMAKRQPGLALFMLVFLFSLAGIPPLAGFIGKFYIFMAAVKAGLIWLAVVGVIFSAVSAYFYLRLIMIMYMHEPEREFEFIQSGPLKAVLGISLFTTVYLGVMPGCVLEFAKKSLAGLL
ncbi:MAG: NADH-quinone oxidoreductase subunit N [Nitrospirota bacterium]|nr:NADH-quinone oxidoreductase subunit N [Nitrospirota bacterium]